jgi:hypothetical protein
MKTRQRDIYCRHALIFKSDLLKETGMDNMSVHAAGVWLLRLGLASSEKEGCAFASLILDHLVLEGIFRWGDPDHDSVIRLTMAERSLVYKTQLDLNASSLGLLNYEALKDQAGHIGIPSKND